jgi:large subunit ribosomal protein L2
MIDFARTAGGVGASASRGVVQRLEYDPNRSARIALLAFEPRAPPAAAVNGTPGTPLTPSFAYIIAPEGLKAGDAVSSGPGAGIFPGNALALRDLPIGTQVHNIEMRPGGGGQLVRAAGTSATLVKKGEDGYATVRLASGEQRLLRSECMATVGAVGNKEHHNRKLGKAGISRHMGRRPHVRGVAMNPVDHPHGGGEGKTSGGRPSVTPWGKPTKGARTRNNKRTDKFIVERRYGRK